MKQDEYSTARPTRKAGTTEVEQLNPSGPEQRTFSDIPFLCNSWGVSGVHLNTLRDRMHV